MLATYSGQSAVSSVALSERGVHTGDKCPTEYVAAYKATIADASSCLVHKNASGKTTCPSDGPRLEALSAGLRRTEDIFAGTFMLTHGGCSCAAALPQRILLAL